jgi:hypothetical protein
LAPWAILHTAVAAESLGETARLQALSVAFEMFRAQHTLATGRRRRGAPVQRGSAADEFTFADANQLRRAMNYCAEVFAAFFLHVGDILLSRIGTHCVEGHFGIIRSILRGVSTWEGWMDAETFAALVPGFRESLGLPRGQPRRSRVLPVGALARRGDESGSAPFAADDDGLLAAARQFINGEHPDLIRDYMEHLLRASGDLVEPARPHAFAGMISQARVMRG